MKKSLTVFDIETMSYLLYDKQYGI